MTNLFKTMFVLCFMEVISFLLVGYRPHTHATSSLANSPLFFWLNGWARKPTHHVSSMSLAWYNDYSCNFIWWVDLSTSEVYTLLLKFIVSINRAYSHRLLRLKTLNVLCNVETRRFWNLLRIRKDGWELSTQRFVLDNRWVTWHTLMSPCSIHECYVGITQHMDDR